MHRKKPCGAGLRPQEQFDWKKLSGGRTAISPLKLDTRAAALSLALLANRVLLETWSCSKRAPSLNI